MGEDKGVQVENYLINQSKFKMKPIQSNIFTCNLIFIPVCIPLLLSLPSASFIGMQIVTQINRCSCSKCPMLNWKVQLKHRYLFVCSRSLNLNNQEQ